MQKILDKFEYKNLLVKEYNHWYFLLRKEQVTLGSMVLIEKSFSTKYSDISSESFSEFGDIVKELENMLRDLFLYDKINYLMLMMVDDEVHYHVIPRYAKERVFNGIVFKDNGWSGFPDFNDVSMLNKDLSFKLIEIMRSKLG